MENHDIDIEITKDGKVKAHIRGAKGKGCLDYAGLLADIVGKIQSQDMTSEHYEPDSVVRIAGTVENKQR